MKGNLHIWQAVKSIMQHGSLIGVLVSRFLFIPMFCVYILLILMKLFFMAILFFSMPFFYIIIKRRHFFFNLLGTKLFKGASLAPLLGMVVPPLPLTLVLHIAFSPCLT